MTDLHHIPGWSQIYEMTAGLPSPGQLQVDFKQWPGPYSIQFKTVGTSNDNVGPNPTAEILWKVRGNLVRRVVSVINGTTISGTGQGVEVNVRDDSQTITGFRYTLSVNVAPGTRPSNVVPPVFLPVVATGSPGRFFVNAVSTTDVPIPANAGVTSVFVTAYPAAPAVLTEADLSVAQMILPLAQKLKEYDPRPVGWCPVASEANFIRLINNSAAGILFGVAFGIDG